MIKYDLFYKVSFIETHDVFIIAAIKVQFLLYDNASHNYITPRGVKSTKIFNSRTSAVTLMTSD